MAMKKYKNKQGNEVELRGCQIVFGEVIICTKVSFTQLQKKQIRLGLHDLIIK